MLLASICLPVSPGNTHGVSEIRVYCTGVPEPSTLALLGIGVISLLGLRLAKAMAVSVNRDRRPSETPLGFGNEDAI